MLTDYIVACVVGCILGIALVITLLEVGSAECEDKYDLPRSEDCVVVFVPKKVAEDIESKPQERK